MYAERPYVDAWSAAWSDVEAAILELRPEADVLNDLVATTLTEYISGQREIAPGLAHGPYT